MDRLDTSRWRLGSLFALLACNGADDAPCRSDDDCAEDQYCGEGTCYEDEDECSDGECECIRDCRECFADSECGPGDVCTEGYCEPIEAMAYWECQREHSLFPKADDFLRVDGVVDLAFVDTQAVIAFPARLDLVEIDEAVTGVGASVFIGEEIVAIDASDLDADGDEDVVVADRGQGGRLIVLLRDTDGSLVQTSEVASPGVLDVALRERGVAMPDAVVRTDAGVGIHVALGDVVTLVEGPVGALAVSGDALLYTGAGTWWLDLSMAAAPAVRLDERTAVAVGWGRIVDDTADAIASFADPASLRVWSEPGELALERELDGPLGGVLSAFLATDLVGDGVDDLVAWSTPKFVVVANRPDDPVACVWGPGIASATRPLLDVGDVDGDGAVDIGVSEGTHFLAWTLDSAVD